MMRRCFWAFVGSLGVLFMALLASMLSLVALIFSPFADLVFWMAARKQRKSLAAMGCHGEPGVDCPVHPMTEENQKPVYVQDPLSRGAEPGHDMGPGAGWIDRTDEFDDLDDEDDNYKLEP